MLARLASAVNDQYVAPDLSKISEQQVGLAIARSIETDHPSAFVLESRVMYQRTATKKEIDFTGPDLDGCVEGKYVDQKWKSEARTARANFARGILATRRAHDLDDGSIWATPAPAVAWLLDRS